MNITLLSQMAGAGGRGGGMPDMNALMNDPMMRDMAARMGMGGGGGAGRRDDSTDGPEDMYS